MSRIHSIELTTNTHKISYTHQNCTCITHNVFVFNRTQMARESRDVFTIMYLIAWMYIKCDEKFVADNLTNR